MITRDDYKNNVTKLVQNLYLTKEYYVNIPPESNDFEESYWGEIIDPDGKKRNRFEEFDTIVPRFQYIANYLKNKDYCNLLDVGCGSGALLSAVKNTCPDIKLYGLDVSKYAAEHASQFAEVYAGNLKDAKYSDNQFDVIATYHVIEHVKDPIPFLKNIKRILKKMVY